MPRDRYMRDDYRDGRDGYRDREYRRMPRDDYDDYDTYDGYDEPYARRGGARRRDSRGRFTSEYREDRRMDQGRRKIGFSGTDDKRHKYMEDDEYIDEGELDYMLDKIPRYLSEKDSDEWVKRMENSDGTTGGHWSREQIKKVYDEHKVKDKSKGQIDEEDFYVVMNMLYSDYCKALKENSGNSLQLYVALAIAFLMDEDAPENKLARYYYCIANG